jgi:hypothetical protein
MMRFKENFHLYASLGMLIILNLIVRAPGWVQMSPYVVGDTTILVWMAESIIEHGKAMWLLNPLSLTGWVDYSYPISVPMLLTITSTMTGLTRVDLVVALSLLYILLAIAAGFSLGYVYSNSKTLALFTAFAVSLSSEFVLYTSDSGSSSARILLITFFVLIIYLLLKVGAKRDIRIIPIILLLTTTVLLAHRASIAIFLILFSYTAAKAALYGYSRLPEENARIFRRYVKYVYILLLYSLFMFTFSSWYPIKSQLNLLKTGLFFSGESPISMSLNMLVDYLAFINPIVILLAALGVFAVLRSERFDFPCVFLLVMLLSFAPIISFSSYASQVITPLAALLFSIGLCSFVVQRSASERRKLASLSVVFLLFTVALLFYTTSLKFTLIYNEPLTSERPRVIEVADYIKSLEGGISSDSHFNARNYMLYSGRPVYPLMGPEYPVYYAKEFENVSFKYSFNPAWLGYVNSMFSIDNISIPKFIPEYKLLLQERPKDRDVVIYDNNFERITRVT